MTSMPLTSSPNDERYLDVNLSTLRLPPLTRNQLDECPPRGSIRRNERGVFELLVDGRNLGGSLPYQDVFERLQDVDEGSALVVFGMGLGHLPRVLRRRRGVPIIVYEPDVGLLKTVLAWGPQDFSDFYITSNIVDLAVIWAQLPGHPRKAKVLSTPGYKNAFPAQADELVEAVRRLVERITITQNTYKKRAKIWVEDIFRNLELLTEAPVFAKLQGKYENVPAFIVGAGPSLDKNVEELRRAGNKGIVFAVNSSAPALQRHGIVPHVLVCLESIDLSHKLAKVPFVDECVRAFSLTANPKTLRTGKGPLLLFHEAVSQYTRPLEELTGARGIRVCGSVSTAAFSLARLLGCSPIVMVGQDLAYTEGRTYAGGTGYEGSTARVNSETGRIDLAWNQEALRAYGTQHGARHESEPLMRAAAWGGNGTVPTGPSFLAIHAWLSGTAELVALENGPRLVNSTEGGAHIPGFQDVTLRALLDQLPDRRIRSADLYEEARATSPPLCCNDLQSWASTQLSLVQHTRRAARRMRRYGEASLRAIATGRPTAVTHAFALLDRAEHDLRAAISNSPLVDAWAHSPVDDLMCPASPEGTSDSRSSAENGVHLGIHLATAIEVSARELQTALVHLVRQLDRSTTDTKGNSPCR